MSTAVASPLPREIEDYPEAFAVVDRLADQYSRVTISRRTTGRDEWLLMCMEEDEVVAVFVVSADGAVRAEC